MAGFMVPNGVKAAEEFYGRIDGGDGSCLKVRKVAAKQNGSSPGFAGEAVEV
jgi:hypothetical protein